MSICGSIRLSLDRILQEHHQGRYGVRRMTAALRTDGHKRKPGHNQVAQLMREYGYSAVIRRANNYKVCVKKGRLPDGTVLENTLDRQFEQPKPRSAFVTDVTYIPVKEGWLYVSPVMDLCTREIVVCEMSTCQNLALGMKTLQELSRVVTGAVVLHSDQGTLYTHCAFRRAAEDLLVKQSYSRKGNCWDNAVMEGWNGTLKTEWLYHPDNRYHKNLLTADEAKREILEYCNYYNEERIQAKLNYRSPKQYREAVVRQA